MTPRVPFLSFARVLTIWFAPFLLACTAAPNPDASAACGTPLSKEVANSCVVRADALWRGARPDPAAASALLELGVKTVVNLEWLNDDRKSFEDAKVAAGRTYQIQYFRVADWEPLVVIAPGKLDDHVAHFMAITRTQPKPIFVHCRSGQNRTGVMVAAYRVFNGADIEETIAQMGKYGGLWFKHDAEYIRTLTPQRRAELEQRIIDWIPRLKRDAQISCSNAKCTSNASRS
jgi:protein tyrosine/serine phosphatase